MLKSVYTQLCSVVLLSVVSLLSNATQITVIDSNNKPVANVVIGLPSKASHVTKSSSDTAIMGQTDYQFLPEILIISVDQWVDFPNSDNVRHHIYSFSAPKPFEIKMFSGSDAEPVQFTKPGLVVLGCNIHDSMVGYIYVSEQELNKITNKQGQLEFLASDLAGIEFMNTASSKVTASVWHPLLSATRTKRIEVLIDLSLSEQVIQLDIDQKSAANIKKSTGFTSKFKRNN